jgi:hypothetical protein
VKGVERWRGLTFKPAQQITYGIENPAELQTKVAILRDFFFAVKLWN